jgi:WD40 repeat protein
MITPELKRAAYPFPGLRPFEPDEAEIFFGREEHVDELLSRIGRRRFLAVVGPSGCGKSSLVRAGMIPALEAGYVANAGGHWQMALMRPGAQPLANLAQALCSLPGFSVEAGSDDEAALRTVLGRGPLGLAEALKEYDFPAGDSLLLLVDQFEELFRVNSPGGVNEAQAFVDLLLTSAQSRGLPAYVVITMRSDFVGHCPRLRGLPEALNDSQYLTPRLNREQLKAAIEGPASLFDGEIAPEVVNRILNEMGSDPDQLPLMQHLLMRMWREETKNRTGGQADRPLRLTLKSYQDVGGLHGCLSSHAEGVYQSFKPAEQKVAEFLLRRLTEVTADRRLVRRPLRLAELEAALAAEGGSDQSGVLHYVIDQLRREGRSFLMPPQREELASSSLIDISHESLIRQWKQLNDWALDEDRLRRVQQMVTAKAARWKENARGTDFLLFGVELAEAQAWNAKYPREVGADEKAILEASVLQAQEKVRRDEALKYTSALETKNRWLWVLSIAVGLFAVVALFFAYLARHQANTAEDNRKKAEGAATLAKKNEAEAKWEAARRRALQLATDARDARQRGLPQLGLLFGVAARAALDAETSRTAGPQKLAEAEHALHHALCVFQRHGIASRALPGHDEAIATMALQGPWLLTGSDDETVRLWDLRVVPGGMPQPRTLPGQFGKVSVVAIDPGEEWLASGSDDGALRLWRFKDPQKAPVVLRAHAAKIVDVEFSEPGPNLKHWLVTAADDGTARRWDLSDPAHIKAETRDVIAHPGAITDIAISRNRQKRQLVTGSKDGSLRIWDLDADDLSQPSSYVDLNRYGAVSRLAISDDAVWLASGSTDGFTDLWQIGDAARAGDSNLSIPGSGSAVRAVAFSPSTRWIAIGRDNGTIELADLASRKESAPPAPPQSLAKVAGARLNGAVKAIAFDAKSQWLAMVAEKDPRIALQRFGVEQGPIGPVMFLEGHEGQVTQIAFARGVDAGADHPAPLVSAGTDGVARLWDLRGENSVRPPRGGKVAIPVGLSSDNAPATIVWHQPARVTPASGSPKKKTGTPMQVASNVDTALHFATQSWDSAANAWQDAKEVKLKVAPSDGGSSSGLAGSRFQVTCAGRWLAVSADTGDAQLHVCDLQAKERQFIPIKIAFGHRNSAGDEAIALPRRAEQSASPPQTADQRRRVIDHVALIQTGPSQPGKDDSAYLLAVVSKDNNLRIWRWASAGQPPSFERPDHVVESPQRGELNRVELSQDGAWAACSHDGQPLLWRLGADTKEFSAPSLAEPSAVAFAGSERQFHKGKLTEIAFSDWARPTQWLATGDDQGQVLLWDLGNRKLPPLLLDGLEGRVTAIRFSPRGTWVGALGPKGVYLWELTNLRAGRPENNILPAQRKIERKDATPLTFAFNAEESSIVATHDDGTLVQWQLADLNPDQPGKRDKQARQAIPFRYFGCGKTDKVNALRFVTAADFVTLSADGGVPQFQLAQAPLSLDGLAAVAGRNFSLAESEEASDELDASTRVFKELLPHPKVIELARKKNEASRLAAWGIGEEMTRQLAQREARRNWVKKILTQARENPAKLGSAVGPPAGALDLAVNLIANEAAALARQGNLRLADEMRQAAARLSEKFNPDRERELASPKGASVIKQLDQLTEEFYRLIADGKLTEAVKTYEQLKLAAHDLPAANDLARRAAEAYERVAEHFIEKNDIPAAQEHLAKARDIELRLPETGGVRPSPENWAAQIQQRLANDNIQEAFRQLAAGRAGEAEKAYHIARKFAPYLREEPAVFVKRAARLVEWLEVQHLVADAIAAAQKGDLPGAEKLLRQAQSYEHYEPTYRGIDPAEFVKQVQAGQILRKVRKEIRDAIDAHYAAPKKPPAGLNFEKQLNDLADAASRDRDLGIVPEQYVNFLVGWNLLRTARTLALKEDVRAKDVLHGAGKRLDAAGPLPAGTRRDGDPDALYYRYANFWRTLFKDGSTLNTAADPMAQKVRALADSGKPSEAAGLLDELQAADPLLLVDALAWNQVCRRGCLHDSAHVNKYLRAGQLAALLEPEQPGYRDSRGVARALTGDIEGAISDFRFYAARTDRQRARENRLSLIADLELVQSKKKQPGDVVNQAMLQGLQGIILDRSGKLTKDDEVDDVWKGSYRQVHAALLRAGRRYAVDLKGGRFIDVLRIEAPDGVPLAEVGGFGPNPQVILQPVVDVACKVIVTTAAPGATGEYRLTIREVQAPLFERLAVPSVREGELTAASPLDSVRKTSRQNTYEVYLNSGITYTVRLRSDDFDAFLRLENSSGKQLAFNDDSEGTLNSRIDFVPPDSGVYRLIATTFRAGATGRYVLTVRANDTSK